MSYRLWKNDLFSVTRKITENKYVILSEKMYLSRFCVKKAEIDLRDYRIDSESFFYDYLSYFNYNSLSELKSYFPFEWKQRLAEIIADCDDIFQETLVSGTKEFCDSYILRIKDVSIINITHMKMNGDGTAQAPCDKCGW